MSSAGVLAHSSKALTTLSFPCLEQKETLVPQASSPQGQSISIGLWRRVDFLLVDFVAGEQRQGLTAQLSTSPRRIGHPVQVHCCIRRCSHGRESIDDFLAFELQDVEEGEGRGQEGWDVGFGQGGRSRYARGRRRRR